MATNPPGTEVERSARASGPARRRAAGGGRIDHEPFLDRVIAAQAATRGVSGEAVRQDWLRQISLRRFVDAEDVAALVLFLTSDAGAKISGQALPVDGHTEGLGSSVDAGSDPSGE
ncbi:MAG: SDR family oxidoreductase [Gemmatimonadales bacterium]|nr:SDR family oxidoreductase [Gemmatimonadales bacterium]MYG18363.1 SDR family oxidoreductase [Gemmatimonadales bacterium]